MKRAFCKSRMPMSRAPTGTKRGHHWSKSKTQNPRPIERADDGIRTRDLRFTKPLLYQLSYIGAERAKMAFRDCAGKREAVRRSRRRAPLQRQTKCFADLA